MNDTKCGFIALIGAPNAGKSSLVNALVGSKVSIVTHKVQTTRALIRGILMVEQAQIVLMDTPGIFKPKRKLDEAMVRTALGGAGDADRVALLIDAKRGISEEIEAIFTQLANIKAPIDLILTKIDLVPREKLLKLTQTINAKATFAHTYMVSSTTNSGLETLKKEWAQVMPLSPWHYPEDDLSDLPMRNLASEVTREKMLLRLHDELPYYSTVETEKWEEKKDGSVRIEQAIFVTREGHKKIVIGEKGGTIKLISQAARKELAELLEREVHLFLFVKVRENWENDPERYREMGIEFPR